jgi:exopolysaccharide biosynthesis polyprenyl glycosylphosphotransferase
MSTTVLEIPEEFAAMSTVDLHLDQGSWQQEEWAAGRSWLPRVLPVLASAVLFVGDLAVVFGAFVVAHWLRFVVASDEGAALGFEHYARIGAIVALLTGALLIAHGTYDLERRPGWPRRINTVVSSVSTAVVLAIGLGFFIGDQSFSRLWLAAGWMVATIVLTGWRSLGAYLYAAIRSALAPAPRVLIVGANTLGREIAGELADRFEVVGYVDNGSDLIGKPDYPLLGPISQLERMVSANAVDELIIALPASRREQVSRVIARGFHRPVQVKFLPGLDELLPQRFEVHDMGGRRYIGFAPVAAVSWLKRALDILLTGMGVLAISPLLMAIAIAVKLDSRGPILYRQQRVGKDGRRFWMYKFRSMVVDADRLLMELRDKNEASGPIFKIRKDPRITRVGKFLRRWSLDELPQLFNVLKGEMSLVGPRPPLPSEVEEYEDWQLGRLRAVPGLTGLWQVSGRSEVPFHDMVRLDLHYIRNWSLGLDVEILLRTLPAVLTSRGAY